MDVFRMGSVEDGLDTEGRVLGTQGKLRKRGASTNNEGGDGRRLLRVATVESARRTAQNNEQSRRVFVFRSVKWYSLPSWVATMCYFDPLYVWPDCGSERARCTAAACTGKADTIYAVVYLTTEMMARNLFDSINVRTVHTVLRVVTSSSTESDSTSINQYLLFTRSHYALLYARPVVSMPVSTLLITRLYWVLMWNKYFSYF